MSRKICVCHDINARMTTSAHATTRASATTTTSASAIGSTKCPKCGTVRKSGKLSCCARGGVWFKKCRDIDDSKAAHTWVEGIQACNYFKSSPPIEAPVQAMIQHESLIAQVTNTTWIRNVLKHQANRHPVKQTADVGTKDSEDGTKLATIVSVASILLIMVTLEL